MAVREDTHRTGARERNRAHIVAAAHQLWRSDSDASMDEVARAAGVVRRTLYGHFATREELLVAVAAQAAEFVDVVAGQPNQGLTPAARLAEMITRLWSDGHDMQLLGAAARQAPHSPIGETLERINRAVAAVVAEGQQSGQFATHLPPAVIAQLLESTAQTLHDAVNEGHWDGNASDVGVTALIICGLNYPAARDVVANL